MITRECPVCKKDYSADPQRLKWGRQTTCSRACSYLLRSELKTKTVEVKCPVCEKLFGVVPSRIKDAKYSPVCSSECLYKGRTAGIIKREVIRAYKKTGQCNRNWNVSRPERIKWITWVCEVCKIVVKRPRKQVGVKHQRRFCSVKCTAIGLSGTGNPAWRGGYDRYYGPTWPEQRRQCRDRDNYTCQDCGMTESAYGKELDVHHIVRFADFTDSIAAHNLTNLVTLCHSCHMYREWREFPELRKP